MRTNEEVVALVTQLNIEQMNAVELDATRHALDDMFRSIDRYVRALGAEGANMETSEEGVVRLREINEEISTYTRYMNSLLECGRRLVLRRLRLRRAAQ